MSYTSAYDDFIHALTWWRESGQRDRLAFEANLRNRVETLKPEVVARLAVCREKDVVVNPGQDHDRRAWIETKVLLLDRGRFAAYGSFLQDQHVVPP